MTAAIKKSTAKKTRKYTPEEMIPYLIDTVREVIETARVPAPVLDKSGQPTGATEYQSATVLKACELMAKLLGTVRETEKNDGFCIQLVSYKDCEESDDDA